MSKARFLPFDYKEKSTLRGRLLFFFFPPKCAVCGEMGFSPLCFDCRRSLEDTFSPKAFLAAGGNGFADGMTSLFPYEAPVAKRLIWQWKSNDFPDLPYIFLPYIRTWYKSWKGPGPDVVTFVPRRQEEKRKNGFDQARCLADALSEELHLPLEPLLFRRGRSKRQHDLPREQRQKNVAGVFHPARSLAGETVLLVDDIVTSGASAKECARVLKLAGAQKVFVLSLAH